IGRACFFRLQPGPIPPRARPSPVPGNGKGAPANALLLKPASFDGEDALNTGENRINLLCFLQIFFTVYDR
ncbi:MAG TPA: hypothetical protein PL180_08095, partial [Spirochaetota bacterium]|nr:hypothetical protein [Spirochaetota bacterium]